jgi:hypothetical protein
MAFANFDVAAGSPCATQKIAPSCWAIDCTAGGATTKAVSSGTLELYAGAQVVLSSMPDGSGIYPSVSSTSATWNAGDAIGLRSAGAALPKFDVAFTAPPAITLTSPVADGGPVALDRTQDLAVSWTGTAAKVIVAASQVPAGSTDLTGSARFICEFDGVSDSATVPASAIATLSATFTGATGLNIGGGDSKDVTIGTRALHAYVIDAQYQTATVK